tara:strand:- start:40 stop:2283 length:2244 start_codon:yes stop_codon:yes gene_type:complete
MAQNDIIDIDQIIDQNIDYSQPIPIMTKAPPVQTVDQIYPSGQDTPGQLVPNDFKNWIMENSNIGPDVLDTILGRPYGFRDRFINVNPLDAIRDLARLSFPGKQPLDETQQPFGLNIMELFDPTDPATKQAENLGMNTSKGAPYQVQKDSTYLPPDNFERGIKALLREAYPGVPLEAFELAKEPNTNRVVYKDPESGEKQFVTPPGIDWADITAIMEPLSLEIGAGLAGFGLGTLDLMGPKTSSVVGAGIGLTATQAVTDNPIWQATGAAAGAVGATLSAPLTFTVAGETLAHFLWRYNNLRGMKERGILDETYDSEKIMKTAIDDSKMVAAFSLGGNAAFSGVAKFLGRNPSGPLGIDEDEFLAAFESVQNMSKGTGAESTVLANITTPQVLAAGEAGTPEVNKRLQNEIDEVIKRDPKTEKIFLNQAEDMDMGYEKIFDDIGIDTVVFRDQDMARVKRDFGRNVGGYFDPKNVRPQTGQKVVPTDRRAVANKVQNLVRGADPEGVFDEIWTAGKITKVNTFLEMMPTAAQKDFKNLIYRDFLEKTKPIDGTFDPNAISKYLVDHGDQLKSVYGEEFTNGLRSYNKLIKDMQVSKTFEGIPDAQIAKMLNVMARAYLGIFTRAGRLITASTKLSEKGRRSGFEKMLLDPELLAKRIKTKQFFESDEGRRFFIGARALARAYEMTDGDLFDVGEGESTDLPTQKQINTGGFNTYFENLSMDEIVESNRKNMNTGGNPLMELKYDIGN